MSTEVDVAILTAKAEEYAAMAKALGGVSVHDGTKEEPNQYAWAIATLLNAKGTGCYSIALGLTHEQTNVPAALAGLATFLQFRPRYIIFVGIAGSLDATVKKGDVVIADYVRAYQYGRVTEDGFQPRAQFQEPTDLALRTSAAAFNAVCDWWLGNEAAPNAGAPHPTLHFGGIASGDAVVEDISGSHFAAVRAADPWLRAVEMESAGLALAVRHLREMGKVTGLMVVRGISDTPSSKDDGTSGAPSGDSNRADRKAWTDYASSVAARFVQQFIRHALPFAPSQRQIDADRDDQNRRQLDPNVFVSFQSRFAGVLDLNAVHSINDETYKPSDLVPRSTLELWWRSNPFTIRLVSTPQGQDIGYWHILPLRNEAFADLVEGRKREAEISSDDILAYTQLQKEGAQIYVTALAARTRFQPSSASVVLDLLAFLRLIDESVGIAAIGAVAVSDDPLGLIARFGMVSADPARSTYVLRSKERVGIAMRRARRDLKSLSGLVPSENREQLKVVRQLFRR